MTSQPNKEGTKEENLSNHTHHSHHSHHRHHHHYKSRSNSKNVTLTDTDLQIESALRRFDKEHESTYTTNNIGTNNQTLAASSNNNTDAQNSNPVLNHVSNNDNCSIALNDDIRPSANDDSSKEQTHHHHLHRKHKHSSYGGDKYSSREFSYLYKNNYYDKNEHYKKKLSKWQIALIVLAGILLAAAITFIIFIVIGQKQLSADNKINTKEITADVDDDIISYNGHKYKFNKNVVSILCMGIDKDNVTINSEYGANGQADAIFLININSLSKEVNITSIPRDSMVNIKTYSTGGKYLETIKGQLCLSFAYGDGNAASCENVCQSVSDYLYGMDINNYYAIDFNAIPQIVSQIGNITVTPNETFTTGNNTFTQGVPITLNRYNTLSYLRSRNGNIDSSYLRMERELDYIKQVSSLCIENTKQDITYPVSLYNNLSSNSITNIGITQISYLATQLFKGDSKMTVNYHKIEGSQVDGANHYVEFYADETKLFELVLDLYYDQID